MGALARCDWPRFHGDTFELHTALDFFNTNLKTVIDSLLTFKVLRPTLLPTINTLAGFPCARTCLQSH